MEHWSIVENSILIMNLAWFLYMSIDRTKEYKTQVRNGFEVVFVVLFFICFIYTSYILKIKIDFIDEVIVMYLMLIGYIDLKFNYFSRHYLYIILPLILLDFCIQKLWRMHYADLVFYVILYLIRKYGAVFMGKGDVDLIFLITMYKGVADSCIITLIALMILIAITICINFLLHQKFRKNQRFPFVPCLCTAYIVILQI